MESYHPDMLANVNALVHHERNIVMHDVDNENDAETINVVVTRFFMG